MVELSIVIPTYNSAGFLEKTLREVYREVSQNIHCFEIIVINDGNDNVINSIVLDLKKKLKNITLVTLNKNYGQQTATHTGIMYSRGKYIITFDDDLQFSPTDIIRMYEKIMEDDKYDICSGFPQKKNKKGMFYSFLQRTMYLSFNNIFFPLFRKSYFFTSFKIYRRTLFFKNDLFLNKNIYFFWEFDPRRINHIFVEHFPRTSGNSGYGIIRLAKFAKHLLLKVFAKINILLLLIAPLLYYYDIISLQTFKTFTIMSIILQCLLYYCLKKIRNLNLNLKGIKCL